MTWPASVVAVEVGLMWRLTLDLGWSVLLIIKSIRLFFARKCVCLDSIHSSYIFRLFVLLTAMHELALLVKVIVSVSPEFGRHAWCIRRRTYVVTDGPGRRWLRTAIQQLGVPDLLLPLDHGSFFSLKNGEARNITVRCYATCCEPKT